MMQSAAVSPPGDVEKSEEVQEAAFSGHCCCFSFNFPCFKSDSWERIPTGEQQESGRSTWWGNGIGALKKAREWSELVAGPKWKTFIRRFNRTGCKAKPSPAKFQYDALSYSLNFDEGRMGQNGQAEDDVVYRNFSSRYAAIPSMNKGQSKDGS